MNPLALYFRVRDAGVSLSLDGEDIRFSGPRQALPQDVLEALRSGKADLRCLLRARDRAERVEPGLPVARLVALLADLGVWPALRDGAVRLVSHEGLPVEDLVPAALADELKRREEEVAAFLRKPASEMSDDELDALGFLPSVRDGAGPVAEWHVPDAKTSLRVIVSEWKEALATAAPRRRRAPREPADQLPLDLGGDGGER